jgi:hypothetical protein
LRRNSPLGRRRGRRTAAGLGILLAATLLGGAAMALATIRVIGSGTQSPNSVATATAICPAGKKLVGGGYALHPAYDPATATGAKSLVQQAFPGDRRAFKVRSFAVAGGTDSTLFSAGLCRTGSITRPANSLPISAATHLSVRVKCPANRHVIGGGFRVSSPYDPATASGSNVSIDTSKRLNDQVWLIGATRDFGPETSVVAHAFCERDFRGRVRSASGSVSAEDVGTYTASADCPAGTKVVSGGFRARPLGTPGSAMTTGLFPWISVNAPLPRKRGWTATIHNDVGPLPGAVLKAFAYCKP